MEKLKERMRKLKDDIELAEQRETEAKNSVRETEANLDRLGGEKTTLQSRINVVQTQLDKITDRLDESTDKLEFALERSAKSEERRKQLAETEVDDYERSEEVETTVKTTTAIKESVAHMVVEGERKILVLEKSLAKATARYKTFSERVDDLSADIFEKTESIRNLEQKDRDSSERESAKEENVKSLETQLHQSINTAEALEREVKRLERLEDQLSVEIENWKKKETEIRAEMEDVIDDVEDEV